MSNNWEEHILLRMLLKNKKLFKKEFHNINEDIFTTNSYNIVAKRVFRLYKNKGEVPSWKEILMDTSISETVRRRVRAKELKRKKISKFDDTKTLPKNYNEYKMILSKVQFEYSRNNLILLQNQLTEDLKTLKSEDQLSNLIKKCDRSLVQIQSNNRSSMQLHHTANKDYTRKLIKNYGKQLKSNFFLPTGYKGFDSKNIGIASDSFWLISGKSGTGKSSLMIDLSKNMKKFGARVCIVPYEMSIEQNLIRLAANLTNIKITDIVKDFEYYEKDLIKHLTKFLYSKDKISCIDFLEPDLTKSVDQVLFDLVPYQYDIVFIDYVNLVPHMNNEVNQATALNLASRFAKGFATKTKTRVCYLAQFDDQENRVRYSRALQEDAANYWYWKQNQEEIEELGYIEMLQRKARNQDPSPFKLKADLATCSYSDYEEEYSDTYKKNKKRTKKLSKGFDEIPSEDDI